MFDPLTNELDRGSGSNNNSNPHKRPYEWKSLLQPTLLGLPLLISYDSSWACSRLRYQIFLNALRLFTPGCELLNKADQALAGGAASIVPQFMLSAQLELRLVDQHGTSASSPFQPADASGAHSLCFIFISWSVCLFSNLHFHHFSSFSLFTVPSSKEIPLEQQIDFIWQGAAAVAVRNKTITSSKSSALNGQLRLPWREACLSLQSHAPPVAEDKKEGSHVHRSTTQQQKGDVEILFGSYLPTNKAVLVGRLIFFISTHTPQT